MPRSEILREQQKDFLDPRIAALPPDNYIGLVREHAGLLTDSPRWLEDFIRPANSLSMLSMRRSGSHSHQATLQNAALAHARNHILHTAT